MVKVPDLKIVEFANRVDPGEMAHYGILFAIPSTSFGHITAL